MHALERRYEKKAAALGMGLQWVQEKARRDVEVVSAEFEKTGKGEVSDQWLIVGFGIF